MRISKYLLCVASMLLIVLILPFNAFSSEEDLSLLAFDSPILKFTPQQVNLPIMQNAIKMSLPYATGVWGSSDPSGGFVMMAGTTPINTSTAATRTRDEARSELRDLAKHFEDQMNSSGVFESTFKLKEKGPLFIIEGRSANKSDSSITLDRKYFYSPDRRLDIRIQMTEAAEPLYSLSLKKGLNAFEEKLLSKYPNGMKFKGE